MQMILDLSSEQPIYQQIYSQILLAIASGALCPNDSLPSVRQLAVDIGVNMHTVNKAYAQLKADGYLVIDRRSGARISGELVPDEALVKRVSAKLSSAALEACTRGMQKADFLALCERVFDSRKEHPYAVV